MSFDINVLSGLAAVWGLKVVAALLVLIVGRWLSGKIAELTARVLERQEIDVTLTRFLKTIIYYALLAAVIVAAAGQLGINTASFLTIIGAAGLAVGLALKDSLGNFAAGVMLILFRPFKVGDFVTAGGESGTVEEITIFNTVLNTPDNQRKIIPNGIITSGIITNVNANSTRRVDLTIGVSYADDLREAQRVLEEVLAGEPRLLAKPAASVVVSELADSSVNFFIRAWVNTPDYWDVRFKLTEAIKLALDQASITIPYPQQDVYLHQVSAD